MSRTYTRLSLFQRASEKILIGDHCWEWTGYRMSNGYGQVNSGGHDGPTVLVHRFMYEYFHGPIPEGLELDHLCRNRACVRPSHLEPVTRRENVERSPICPSALNMRKTTCPRGHVYDFANARGRACRTCRRIKSHQRYQDWRQANPDAPRRDFHG